MKKISGVYILLFVILFYVSGCMPFARMFDSVGNTIRNEDNDITQDATLITDTPFVTSTQNNYKSADALSNNNPAPTNGSNQPYPVNGQEVKESAQPNTNPYPGSGEITTTTVFVNPYPGATVGLPTSPSSSLLPTFTPTTANPYPYPTSAQPTKVPQSTQTQQQTVTPTITSTLVPTPIPTTEDVDFHLTDPQTVNLSCGKLQLVEFFAYWCGTCRSMAPLLNELESKYSTQMNFVFLDIDDPETEIFKEKLGYKWQPHFFLISESGEILKQWVGYVPIQEIETAIQSYLH